MTIPVSGPGGPSGKPKTNPHVTGSGGSFAGPNGWYFVQFLDGSVALVYLKNHVWQWSKNGAPPASAGPPTPWFLGAVSDIESAAGRAKLNGLLQHNANAHQASIIMGAIDAGIGRSVYAPTSGPAKGIKFGSDAAPVQNAYDVAGKAAANAASSIASGLGAGLEGDAIRVLEVVGGVLLLVLGLHAFLGGDNLVTQAATKAHHGLLG